MRLFCKILCKQLHKIDILHRIDVIREKDSGKIGEKTYGKRAICNKIKKPTQQKASTG